MFLSIFFICTFSLDVYRLADTVNTIPDASWVAYPNPKFAPMSEEDFSVLNGAIPPPSESSSYVPLENTDIDSNANVLPESFDSQEQWPSCWTIGNIYDQGHCGSCWAMCTFEVFQDRVCIFSNGTLRPELSGQQLTSCDHSSNGCQGFTFSYSFFVAIFLSI